MIALSKYSLFDDMKLLMLMGTIITSKFDTLSFFWRKKCGEN